MPSSDVTWTTQELEQAVAWMAQCYLRTPRGINPTHAQGRLAEQLVMGRLNDGARVGPLMFNWRRAQVVQGNVARQRAAASNPDWLVLDEKAAITAVVEVKAVRGDAGTIDDDRQSYRSVWDPHPDLVTADLNAWRERMARVWVGRGPRFAAQLSNHLNRLEQLAEAGVVHTDGVIQLLLYVPAGETYFDIPDEVQSYNGQAVPLRIRRLPALHTLGQVLERAWREAYGTRPLPAERTPPRSRGTADEVRARLPDMLELLVDLRRLFGSDSTAELDARLSRLLIGLHPVYNLELPGQTLSWRDTEGILARLNSVAPSLTAHVLFDAVGRRNGSSSRQEREAFGRALAGRRSTLDPDQSARLLASLTRLRLRLRNRGWRLPPFSELIVRVLGND